MFAPSTRLRGFTAFCLASLLTAPTLVSAAPDFPCSEGSGTAALALAWSDLPSEDSLVRLPTGIARLVVRNTTNQTLFVELSAAAVLDRERGTLDLGTAVVPPTGSVGVPIDLGAFGVAPGTLDFSAQVAIKGVARNDQGAPVSAVAYSPHAYFHAKDKQWLVYRERVLRKAFNSGDFGDRATKLLAWARGRGLQVAGIGYYDPELNLTDDDGGPPDPDPQCPNPPCRHTKNTDSHTEDSHHHEVTP